MAESDSHGPQGHSYENAWTGVDKSSQRGTLTFDYVNVSVPPVSSDPFVS